jgi:hypothetical protein
VKERLKRCLSGIVLVFCAGSGDFKVMGYYGERKSLMAVMRFDAMFGVAASGFDPFDSV